MRTFIGFDPGGFGNFGWAVLSGDRLPLQLVARGTAHHAQGAFETAVKFAGTNIQAVGIDAPLFWHQAGDRTADKLVRNAIVRLGSSGGTVNAINSLFGACLIQGMMAGMLCQQRISQEIALTEAHPKALLWLLGQATKEVSPGKIVLSDLSAYVVGDDVTMTNDHERDAALGAVTAFAMASKMPGWHDLYPLEPAPISPLNPPPGYWMPGCS